MSPESVNVIVSKVMPRTMTVETSVRELIEHVQGIIQRRIPGSFVECGVWRGGSMMAIALTLRDLGVEDRELYLFDTFEGNPRPDPVDIDLFGTTALSMFQANQIGEDQSKWCFASLADVNSGMSSTGYPMERVHFVQGKVENTLPTQELGKIALLRLDTDFYSSTKQELGCLVPLLSSGGILIIDDYGHWAGCKKATDEYLAARVPCLTLIACGYSLKVAMIP